MENKKEEILKKLRESVKNYDIEAVIEITKDALKEGIDAQIGLNEGLARGFIELGDLYEKEIFAPELMASADAFNEGLNILKPQLIKEKAEEKKEVVVLGVMEGDIHDLGKEFVKYLLIAQGFVVHDLGYDVKLGRFIEEVIKTNADILAMSALMTSTMVKMKKVIELVFFKPNFQTSYISYITVISFNMDFMIIQTTRYPLRSPMSQVFYTNQN